MLKQVVHTVTTVLTADFLNGSRNELSICRTRYYAIRTVKKGITYSRNQQPKLDKINDASDLTNN
jgi:uncharacterized protein (DUF2237 family)